MKGNKKINIDVTTESSRNIGFVYILFYEREDIAECTKDIIEEKLANDIEIESPQYEIEDCENKIVSANLVSSYSTDTETINIFNDEYSEREWESSDEIETSDEVFVDNVWVRIGRQNSGSGEDNSRSHILYDEDSEEEFTTDEDFVLDSEHESEIEIVEAKVNEGSSDEEFIDSGEDDSSSSESDAIQPHRVQINRKRVIVLESEHESDEEVVEASVEDVEEEEEEGFEETQDEVVEEVDGVEEEEKSEFIKNVVYLFVNCISFF